MGTLARSRRTAADAVARWVRIGAVAVGVGAAISSGQAIASAAPPDTDAADHSAGSAEPRKPGPTGTAAPGATSAAPQRARPRPDAVAARVPRPTQRATGEDATVRPKPNRGHDIDTPADPAVTKSPAGTRSGPGAAQDNPRKSARASTPRSVDRPAWRTDPARPERRTGVLRLPDDPSPAAEPPKSVAVSETAADPRREEPNNPAIARRTAEIFTPATIFTEAPAPARRADGVPVHRALAGARTLLGPGAPTTGPPPPRMPVENLVASLWLAARETQSRRTPIGSKPTATVVTDSPAQRGIEFADLAARSDVTATANADGTVGVVNGAFADTTVTDAAQAADVFNQMSGLIGAPADFASEANVTVQRVGVSEDDSETFYRLRHTVGGIDVLGSEVILATDADGTITGLFNNYDGRVDDIELTAARGIDSRTEAAAAAIAAYVGSPNARPYRVIAAPLIAAGVIKPELVIDALDADTVPQLAWRVVVDPPDAADLVAGAASDPGSTYYIAAGGDHAGTVIRQMSNANALALGSAATDTAADDLGASRQIDVARLGLLIIQIDNLHDLTRDIETARTAYFFFIGPPITPGVPVFRGLFGWDTSAVSAHANMAEVYDYYSDVLGLTSFDGTGAPVVISIQYNPRASLSDYTDGYNNAFWDSSSQQFAFGDTGDLEAAVDIVGHEFTHAVVDYAVGDGNSSLDYGEPGALNEAYADILGALIEGKTGLDRWLMGEDATGGPIRNLADPTSIETSYGPYRASYADRYTGSGDEGGEHVNSTIFSHAAYLMMTDPATSAISDDAWARLFYRSLYRLSPGAVFADGRAAVLSTAIASGYTDAQVDAIERAFDRVGIAESRTVVV